MSQRIIMNWENYNVLKGSTQFFSNGFEKLGHLQNQEAMKNDQRTTGNS